MPARRLKRDDSLMGLRRLLRREAAPMSEEQRDREAARQAHTAEYAREEQQVLAALRSARLHVNDLPDLINELEPEDYKAQMPALVDWLGRVSYPPVIFDARTCARRRRRARRGARVDRCAACGTATGSVERGSADPRAAAARRRGGSALFAWFGDRSDCGA